LDIDPEDLANLGIKDNFESFLKRNVKETLEFGEEMSEENLKLMKKFGINFDELKEGVKPIHKELDQDKIVEVFSSIFSSKLLKKFLIKVIHA